uniref:Uncharacterized protein n=1 Tax=Oryzias latipes TaxID=8090 RepID=A0A3P9K9P1_ORYLA
LLVEEAPPGMWLRRPLVSVFCSGGTGTTGGMLNVRAAAGQSVSMKDDTLKYLSPEEQETLQFFEQTIDSLDDSISATPHQEIIDLVHPDLDLMPPREPIFNPSNPGNAGEDVHPGYRELMVLILKSKDFTVKKKLNCFHNISVV